MMKVKYFPFIFLKNISERDRASIIVDTQEFNIMRNAKIYFIRTFKNTLYGEGSVERFNASQMYQGFHVLRLFMPLLSYFIP